MRPAFVSLLFLLSFATIQAAPAPLPKGRPGPTPPTTEEVGSFLNYWYSIEVITIEQYGPRLWYVVGDAREGSYGRHWFERRVYLVKWLGPSERAGRLRLELVDLSDARQLKRP